VAADERTPGRRPEERRQDADRRRLPRAVRTEQAERFARLDRKRHAAHGLDLAEALLEPSDLDGQVGGGGKIHW
jgi:hypothetical protein